MAKKRSKGRKKKTQKTIRGKRIYRNRNMALRAKDRAPRSQRVNKRKDKFGVYYTVTNK